MTQLATKLTAYNKDVQRYMMHGNKGGSSTVRKTTILGTIEEAVINAGGSFEKLFPVKSKRQAILDEITYYLSGTGICKVSAAKLAEKVGASVRTVSAAVKSIKETGQILVAGLADGKNKYVFVLKSHPNFKNIMKEVFFIDNAEQIAGQIAEQKNSEPVGTVSVECEKTSSNHNNFINSLQEKDIIKQSVENDLQNSKENTAEARVKLQTYTSNEYQIMLFDEIMSFPFPKAIKDVAGILALRVGMDCDAKKVRKSLQLLNKMAVNMMDGVEIRNVAAVFSEGMNSKKSVFSERVAVIEPKRTNKVPFYNWLEERS